MSNTVELEQQENFRFAIRFGDAIPALDADEAPPLGKGAGPTPVQLLAAAVGNCLSDSLLFALRKFKQVPDPIHAVVEAIVERNPENHLRVQRIAVRLTVGVLGSSLQHLDRALAQFEDFCTVAQSVRQAVPIEVEVYDSQGARLK